MFFELSQRPDIVAAIHREIKELGEENPTWEHLRSMKYLNWVIKEALRLHPPVASNQREAVRDTVLPRGGGADGKSPVFVKAGTNLRYLPWVMHRRQDIFGEDAEEFRPERWEELRVTYVSSLHASLSNAPFPPFLFIYFLGFPPLCVHPVMHDMAWHL
jgi:cytochrome P450